MTSKGKSSSTPLWVLSIHAAARAEQRNIRHDWIDRAIRHPDQTQTDPDDPDLTLVYKRIGEKGLLKIRVVYNHVEKPYVVITAMWESR